MPYHRLMAGPIRPARIGLLLTHLGSRAAENLAAKTRELGITPPEAGVVRVLGSRSGVNQRELAEMLGVAKSRVVSLVDSLEAAGLVNRERSTSDRRNQVLMLTEDGRALLAKLSIAAEAQDADLAQGLSAADRSHLYELLLKLDDGVGLERDVRRGVRARE